VARPDEVAWTALALWALSVLVVTALSPFRLSHYGLPASFGIALLARTPGRSTTAGVWRWSTRPSSP